MGWTRSARGTVWSPLGGSAKDVREANGSKEVFSGCGCVQTWATELCKHAARVCGNYSAPCERFGRRSSRSLEDGGAMVQLVARDLAHLSCTCPTSGARKNGKFF